MIHVFHGFLGSPSDFSYLQDHKDVVVHDLLSFDENNLSLDKEDTLIGYSMGGRIAMNLARKADFKIKHLILLNSHPGLESDIEKSQRKIWEDQILEKMNEENFIESWNELPLFKNDSPLKEISEQRIHKFKTLFDDFRLSNQFNFLPLLKENKHKVIYLIGQDDPKYRKLSQEKLIPEGIRCHLIEGGHRLFNFPESVLNVLNFEGIL